MFYLSAADGALSKEDTAELEKELQSAGADIRAFEYVKRHKEILRMTLAPGASGLGGASTPMQGVGSQGELFKGLNAISSRVCTFRLMKCQLRLTVTVVYKSTS
jgi:hypothetical protein